MAFPGGGTSLQQFRGALGPKRKSCGRAIYSAALEKQDEKKKKERKKICMKILLSTFTCRRLAFCEASEKSGAQLESARLAVAALQQQQQCHSAHYFKSRECLFHKTLLRALYKKKKKKLLSISNNFFSVTFGGNECAPSLFNLQTLRKSKNDMIRFFFFLRTPMFISAITAKERDQVKAPAAFFSSHMKTL